MVSAVVGCAALATGVVVAADANSAWWWTAAGLLAAALLAATAAEGRIAGTSAAAGLAVAAAATSGVAVWSNGPDTVGRVLAADAPTAVACTAWLLAAVTAVVIMVATRDRAVAPVSGPVIAAAVLVGGLVGGAALTGGALLHDVRADAIRHSQFDTTVDHDAPDGAGRLGDDLLAGPRGPVEQAWRADLDAYGATTVAVAGTDVVLTHVLGERTGVGDDRRSGVVARDARTGEERWRFTTSLWAAMSGVAVSPDIGRVVVGVADAVIVLDLGTGAELTRIALPAPPGQGRYRVLGPEPVDGGHQPITVDPGIVLAGHSVSLAAASSAGSSDVVTVSLIDDRATVIATAVPQSCRLRAAHAGPIAPAVVSWIVRDGVGCGAPRVIELLTGQPSAEYDVPVADGCELGCDLVDVFVDGSSLVVQAPAEVLTFEYAEITARQPSTPDQRAAVTGDGLALRAATPDPRRVPVDHTIDGDAVVLPSGDRAGPIPCGEPAAVTVSAGVLVVSCGGDRPTTVTFAPRR